MLRQARVLIEKHYGLESEETAKIINNLGLVFQEQGKYQAALALYEQALNAREKLDASHPVSLVLSYNVATVLYFQGRYKESERIFLRTLAGRERKFGPDNIYVGETLGNLALVWIAQRRYPEAEAALLRAVAVREKVLGVGNLQLLDALNNLGLIYRRQKKFAQAEEIYKRALAVLRSARGDGHPTEAKFLNNLGLVYDDQKRSDDAFDAYRRSLAITEKAFGPSHSETRWPLNNLALLHEEKGRYDEAERLFKRALSTSESGPAANALDAANTLGNLASLATTRGNMVDALGFARRATSALRKSEAADWASAMGRSSEAGGSEHRRLFLLHMDSLSAATSRTVEDPAVLGREAFELAQLTGHSSASLAIQQVSVRLASGEGGLATLVREHQDLSAVWSEKNKALVGDLTATEQRRSDERYAALRNEVAAIETRLNTVAARLDKEHPDYAALIRPKPLAAAAAQKLLREDEVLVLVLAGPGSAYTFALTRDDFHWARVPMGEGTLSDKVLAFRRGLDVDELNNALVAGRKPPPFDLDGANELYRALLGPVERLIRDKRHLIVVPSGPLTALPFHLLVTDKRASPKADEKAADEQTVYRETAWLLKRHAVSVLPSIASLGAFRNGGSRTSATKPIVGFADPMFGPELAPPAPGAAKAAAKGKDAQKSAKAPAARTRSYGDYWQGAGVDRQRLAQSLPQLPDSADELKSIA